eukprot:SAG31_NODE_3407_length_4307_cov_8.014971_4_plen_162_part_00
MELLPALRTLGMGFQARGVLAGGMLSGVHMGLTAPKSGSRLAGSCTGTSSGGICIGAPRYAELFWNDCHRTAVEKLASVCAANDPVIEPAEAAIRWLARHSALDAVQGDSLVIGVSSVTQVNSVLTAATNAEPLPELVLAALEAGWKECASYSPLRTDGWV